MLLHHIRIFEIICTIPTRFGLVKTEWNHKNRQLLIIEQPKLWKFDSLRIKIWIHTIFTLVIGVQTFYSFTKNKSSFANGFLYGIALIVFVPSNLLVWSCFKNASTLCAFINGIVQLESSSKSFSKFPIKRKYSLIEKLNLFGAYAIVPTVTIYHLVYLYGLHWNSPCKPSIALYFLIPDCYSFKSLESFPSKIIKVVIFLLNHWVWIFSMYTAQFVVGVVNIICTLSFRDFLYTFDQIQDSVADLDELMYRKIQVLNGLCNEVQRGAPMFLIMFCGAFINAVAMTGMALVPWSKANVLPLAVFVVLLVYTILFLLVFLGGMANILQYSRRLLQKRRTLELVLGSNGNLNPKKRKQKFYVSCQPIKFKFGELNFVDRLTPLNCTVFANRMTLQLLLLGGKALRNSV